MNRLLSTLTCLAAGIYLLQTQAVGESSYLEAIAHGMGIYFIGKGLFVWGSLGLQEKTVVTLEAIEVQRAPDSTG